jgi:hypothetical protein
MKPINSNNRPINYIFLIIIILSTSILFTCSTGSTKQATEPSISSFSINGTPGIITSYDNALNTTNYNITIQLPESTDVTNLLPTFTVSPNTTQVIVNQTPIHSGKSQLDFSNPVIFTAVGSSSSDVTTYTVAVNYGVLTSNITERTYYSIKNGLSTNVAVTLTGAYSANGKKISSNQVYKIESIELVGKPSFEEIISGTANSVLYVPPLYTSNNLSQIPIGTPIALVFIAAFLLFHPHLYYYPTLSYHIPVVP